MLEIYTDGSTRRNGAKDAAGGFGVVVAEDGKVINAYSAFASQTTNNQEEMKAILWAIYHYGDKIPAPIVYSDSSYAVNSFTKWLEGWKARGWLKSNNKPVENLSFIKLYDIIKNEQKKEIDLRYIKGHAGHMGNELADQLATGKVKPKDIIGRVIK